MDDTGETFVCEFVVPVQVTLDPEWEAMAHDHALKTAHEQGVIPIGPIHIETTLIKQKPLVEGQPLMVQRLSDFPEVVRVKASMMVGSRLG